MDKLDCKGGLRRARELKSTEELCQGRFLSSSKEIPDIFIKSSNEILFIKENSGMTVWDWIVSLVSDRFSQ